MNSKDFKIYSRVTLATVGLFTFLALTRLTGLGFDYDFEKFFPKDDSDSKSFSTFRETFENDYDYLLIGVPSKRSVFDTAFLQKVNVFCDSLRSVEYVTDVVSVSDFRIPVISGFTVLKKRILHTDDPIQLKADSAALMKAGIFTGGLISTDAKTLCVVLKTEEKLSKKKSDLALQGIQKAVENSGLEGIYMAGKIMAQSVYVDKVTREFFLFMAIAVILVSIILIWFFRSAPGLWVPLSVVLISIIWTLAFMEIMGKKIDILTALMPTILFVVGMSDVVHIYAKYLDEIQRPGATKESALWKTLKEVGMATLLTSFTTAVGFITLISVGLQPVSEFGIYTAVGVAFAYVITILLQPAVLYLSKIPSPRNLYSSVKDPMRPLLIFVIRRRKLILMGSALVLIVSFWGMSRIVINNFLIEDLRESEPLKQDIRRFENDFSGIRPFEMMIEGENLTDYQNIVMIDSTEKIMQKHFGLGFIQSPATFFKIAYMSSRLGNPEYYKIPETDSAHQKLLTMMKLGGITKDPVFLRYLNKDATVGRIQAKMHDIGSREMLRLEKSYTDSLLPTMSTFPFKLTLTGSARLIDKNIEHLTVNLMQGLFIAVVIISLIAGLMFKSLRMIIIAIIPNLLPLVMIAGFMGFSGIALKSSTAIIFTIGFGIAVDDTIHFLSRLKLELLAGKPLALAVRRSFLGTGKALILTTIVLISGFLPMIFSSFLSTFYVGFLLSMILLLALLADVLLLPILILMFYKPQVKRLTKD